MKNTIKSFEIPAVEETLKIPMNIFSDMVRIMEGAGTDEVGWYLTTPADDMFSVNNLYLPNQKVHGATTEFDSDEKENDAQSDFMIENMGDRFTVWCHSHVNMTPTPSGQDDTQITELVEACDGLEWIRLIMNKSLKYTCILSDGITERDVEIEIVDNQEGYQPKYKEVKDKVKKLTYTAPKSTYKWTGKSYNNNVYNNGKKKDEKKESVNYVSYDTLQEAEEVEAYDYGVDVLGLDNYILEPDEGLIDLYKEEYFDSYYGDGIDANDFVRDITDITTEESRMLLEEIRLDVRYKF